jgi:VanZ family protein
MVSFAYYLKHYWKSFIVLVAIWVLSLVPAFPETPMDDVPFVDKWVHFAMYGGFTLVIWWEYLTCHRFIDYAKLVMFGVIAPMLMGGLLEILQATCTTCRSGEWLDFLANSVGVLLGSAAGLALNHWWFRRRS